MSRDLHHWFYWSVDVTWLASMIIDSIGQLMSRDLYHGFYWSVDVTWLAPRTICNKKNDTFRKKQTHPLIQAVIPPTFHEARVHFKTSQRHDKVHPREVSRHRTTLFDHEMLGDDNTLLASSWGLVLLARVRISLSQSPYSQNKRNADTTFFFWKKRDTRNSFQHFVFRKSRTSQIKILW
jgi:hypothetical protein